MHKAYKIIIGLLIIGIVVSIFVYRAKFNKTTNNIQNPGSVAGTFFQNPGQVNPTESQAGAQEQKPLGAAVSYTSPDFGFSFNYDNSLKQGAFDDGDGKVVLLQNAQSKGVQISITPFDEDISLTPERMKKDIPDLKMDSTKTISVGGTQAVSFKNVDDKTLEVWFVRNKELYQAVTTPDMENSLNTILQSWKWE